MKKFNLENIDKKHPFKVPDAYFDGLGERIHQRISNNSLGDSAENNLESGLLKDFDKKMPFGTPERYFEDFSVRLDERIKLKNNQQDSQQDSQQEIKIYAPKPFYAKFRTYAKSLAIAAAVVLLGGFVYVIYDNNQQDNQQNNIENLLAFNDIPKDISNNEIVEYFKEHHTDNNENYVLEHITETHITETHLEELGSSQEISKDILKESPKEIPKESSQENQGKNQIINDLPKEELQEMLNNGELEEEILD